jgi:hypothetical protein
MKPLLVSLLAIVFLISCGEKNLELRDEIKNENLKGTWIDIGQLYQGIPVNSSTKGALITFNPDGTFQSPNEDIIFGIGNEGKWTYDASLKKISFEYDDEVLPGTENYKINKYWIINSFENNILDVMNCQYRKQSVIVNPLTNEIVGTIDSVDYKVSRRFQKQD